MNRNTFITHIQNHKNINLDVTLELEKITKTYPYFQAAKAFYLKGLKQNNNYKYNKVLKETAALTTDRSILFEFINQLSLVPNKTTTITSEQQKNILAEKTTIAHIEDELKIGTPLDFTKNETHSFGEWLQLSKFEPIARKEKPTASNTLFKNIDLIDRFIENNPSIKPIDKDLKPLKASKSSIENSGLMTETLAKVYLEQKKYNSAIKAYQILSLKYPEKSGFFADQIKKIEFLKINKS